MFKVDNSLAKPNIPRTIRFSERVFNSLLQITEKENISFNALVLQCCCYAIENYEKIGELSENIKE